MENPWTKLPSAPAFVLASDQHLINIHNGRAVENYKIVTEMYPEPYVGNPEADIVILNLNPGFDGENDLRQHQKNLPFIDLLKSNLNHTHLDYPFFYLDPTVSDTPGYRWWNKRLKTLLKSVGSKKLANSLLCLEFFPYHSSKFNFNQVLESQQYTFELLRKAIGRGATIICFRALSKWLQAVPELAIYDNLYKLNSSQSVYLTYNNCPQGYNIILEQFGIQPQQETNKEKKTYLKPLQPSPIAGVPQIEAPISVSTKQMTNMDLRSGIIEAVRVEIKAKGLQEHIKTPETRIYKAKFDAHIGLTDFGKSKFKPKAKTPSKQLIHKDLNKLQINGEICPSKYVDLLPYYKAYAVAKFHEFLLEMNHH
jgi:hypothetical protein